MPDDLPAGVSVETIYVVEVPYGPDAPMKRPAVRHEHLTRIARLKAEGRLIEAGGFLDFSSALLLVRAADEAAAEALIRDDIYFRSGVWVGDLTVRAYGRVVTS